MNGLSNSKKVSPRFWRLTKILWHLFPYKHYFPSVILFLVMLGGWREEGCLNVFSVFSLGSSFPFKKWIGWLISCSMTCLGLCRSFRKLATVSCSFLPACMPRFPTCRWQAWWATISCHYGELGWGQSMNMGRKFRKHLRVHSWIPAHSFLSSCNSSGSYFWSDHVGSSSIPMLTLRSQRLPVPLLSVFSIFFNLIARLSSDTDITHCIIKLGCCHCQFVNSHHLIFMFCLLWGSVAFAYF